MDIARKTLILVYLINTKYQPVKGGSIRSFDWLEDVDGTGLTPTHGSSLLTTSSISLVTCLTRCSDTAKYKTATYNNGTGECNCLTGKTEMTSQLGNCLWRRHFDGFLYNEQLNWYIRLFTNIQKTQAEAESFCSTLDGRLAVLDTDEKFYYLTGLSDYRADKFYYVGATYEENENVFRWSNGANITHHWTPGEPNGYRSETCVALYLTAFVDIHCAQPLDFACEIV